MTKRYDFSFTLANRLRWVIIAWLLFLAWLANSQTALPVGSGSYASSIPASAQFIGGYYSMTAQQVVNQYTNLHMDRALRNRPIPSNKWWTDLLVADTSKSTNNAPRFLEQSAFGGLLWAYPAAVSCYESGLNLFYPKQWNARSNPNFPEGGFATGPALPITGSISNSLGTNDVLIADFNGTSYPAGWTSTGTAFGTGPIVGGTWPGELPAVEGYIGSACVNTYRGSDAPQGTLTSTNFVLQKKFIHVLAGGGNNTNNAAVWLVIGTNVVRTATGKQSGTLYWNTWDVSAYLGQSAKIQIVDLTSGSWGFILCSWIVASDDGSNPALRYGTTFRPGQSTVMDWSDWGVQFKLADASQRRMDFTLARGVPFVWASFSGVNPVINLGSSLLYGTNGSLIQRTNGAPFQASAFAFDYQGRTVGVFAPENTVFSSSASAITAQLSGTNNYLVFGLLPSITNLNEFAAYAYARVVGTKMDWSYDRTNGKVNTTWALTTQPLQGTQTNTLQGWLPHHYRTTYNNLEFKPYTYLTPRGIMRISAGSTFQVSYDFHGICPVLPAPHINRLTNDYAASRMSNYILNFAASHPNSIANTYYGGKDLAITAQYITLARQLGMTNQVNQLVSGLRAQLTNWFTYTPGETGFYFARYGNWRALVGFPADFGSEAFNDNHFHYGYFVVASALLATEDPNFLTQYGPMARLIAKQSANWDRNDLSFPLLRTFEIWEGHSWAGGFSSSGGENQESSSEAMNSWAGLFLLGNMLGDDAMTAAGAMGYAVESSAVNEYWQDMYRTNTPASYGKGMVGIVHSGGISYATFFNGDPAWIHGIQWVPANHWNNYLARDKAYAQWQFTNLWNERILASQYGINAFKLEDANTPASLGGYLGNYVLGFQVLFDPAGVASQMDAAWSSKADIATDTTYSGATYYLAHSLRSLGDPDPNCYTDLPTGQVYSNATTGIRTAVIYNPAATSQAVTIYDRGTPIGTVSVPPRRLAVNTPGYTNRVTLTTQTGIQLSWAATPGYSYQPQWAESASNSVWNNFSEIPTSESLTQSLFVVSNRLAQAYRVLEVTPPSSTSPSLIINGGFETGNGTTPANWSISGSQPPVRSTLAARSGSYGLVLSVTNTSTTPNGWQFQQNIVAQGGSSIQPGQSYNFSFWAKQISFGVSYVQNYRVNWLNQNGGVISSVGWTGFSGGNSSWSQVTATNLIAPANAYNVLLELYGTTGAVLAGNGKVYIDDVSLALNTPGQTNIIQPSVLPSIQLSWASEAGKQYQLQWSNSLSANNWSNTPPIIVGDGDIKTVVQPTTLDKSRFYRVMELQ